MVFVSLPRLKTKGNPVKIRGCTRSCKSPNQIFEHTMPLQDQ
jgi:hypothetical protein